MANKEAVTVVAVSSNTNSFGLKSVIFFRDDRRAFQGLQSAYGSQPLPFRGQRFAFLPAGLECVTELPRPSVKVFKLALSASTLANAPKS
jgi:hypothetical protein